MKDPFGETLKNQADFNPSCNRKESKEWCG